MYNTQIEIVYQGLHSTDKVESVTIYHRDRSPLTFVNYSTHYDVNEIANGYLVLASRMSLPVLHILPQDQVYGIDTKDSTYATIILM